MLKRTTEGADVTRMMFLIIRVILFISAISGSMETVFLPQMARMYAD
jgi:hypothetical protein